MHATPRMKRSACYAMHNMHLCKLIGRDDEYNEAVQADARMQHHAAAHACNVMHNTHLSKLVGRNVKLDEATQISQRLNVCELIAAEAQHLQVRV